MDKQDKQSLRESWVQRIEAYRKSGLSAKVWCAKNSLNVHTLRYWIQKTGRQKQDTQTWASVSLETLEKSSPSPIQICYRDFSIYLSLTLSQWYPPVYVRRNEKVIRKNILSTTLSHNLTKKSYRS